MHFRRHVGNWGGLFHIFLLFGGKAAADFRFRIAFLQSYINANIKKNVHERYAPKLTDSNSKKTLCYPLLKSYSIPLLGIQTNAPIFFRYSTLANATSPFPIVNRYIGKANDIWMRQNSSSLYHWRKLCRGNWNVTVIDARLPSGRAAGRVFIENGVMQRPSLLSVVDGCFSGCDGNDENGDGKINDNDLSSISPLSFPSKFL